jgi:hypothetical protein
MSASGVAVSARCFVPVGVAVTQRRTRQEGRLLAVVLPVGQVGAARPSAYVLQLDRAVRLHRAVPPGAPLVMR